MVGGRQRCFDTQEALEKAMHVFWKKGFLGASLTELTSSMGINKPSLYAAFGNKEELFISAVSYYYEHEVKPRTALLYTENRSLTERVKAYLKSSADMICDSTKPGGCFVTAASNEMAGQTLPEKATQAIIDATQYNENMFFDFFEAEKSKGNLAADTHIHDITLFIMTLLHGMAALARKGKSREAIYTIIDVAILVVSEAEKA
ncbi:MAG: TetR family transcriptional regulator [Methylophaga sp.]|nr:MAG: TetR family transcriptional regulator [Methylophaga sp.]